MWRLFVPLRYLRIRHAEWATFNVYVPFGFAILLTLPLLSSEFRSDAMAARGLLDRSSDLLSVLTGFFVAALAAVATFGNPEMDEPLSGTEPATLRERRGPPMELSRRRFLSYLFGYLALVSLITYGLGFILIAIQEYVVQQNWPEAAAYTFSAFWALYALFLGSLLANGLLGLFYLTDRIHRPNRVVSFKANRPSDDREAA